MGGGYMVSGKGQNKDIKAIYYQNQNISTYNILVRFHLHLSTFIFPIPCQQAIKVSGICQRQAGRATLITTSINLLRARATALGKLMGIPCHAVPAAPAI